MTFFEAGGKSFTMNVIMMMATASKGLNIFGKLAIDELKEDTSFGLQL